MLLICKYDSKIRYWNGSSPYEFKLSGICRVFAVGLPCYKQRLCLTILVHKRKGMLTMIVRKLRLQRGWSQEQLAQISGLNVRTIQRIERGQKPGLESKKSLAAAFDVQLATFDENQHVAAINDNEANMTKQNEKSIEEIKADEEYAINYAKGIKEFYNHLMMYLIFAVMIVFVKGFDDMIVFWGLLGWTLGVIIHGLNAYELINIFNANWERKIAEKKLGRKL